MHGSRPIAEYLAALSQAMGFDVALSRRVRKEVEDHLWQSLADAANGDSIEAQNHAIARLGDPEEIARQYVVSSLFAQTRRVGIALLFTLLGIYVAMKGRGVWYGFIQWGLTERVKDSVATWATIDLNAFRIALAFGIVGLVYVASRRLPGSFRRSYRRQAKLCVVLCSATAGALSASVLSDIVITGLRLLEAERLALTLIPLLSIGAEIALMATLGLLIRTTVQRIVSASSLLQG